MSNISKYSNISLLGAVIEGYSYNYSTKKMDESVVKGYVVDKIKLTTVDIYITVLISPSISEYTSISATDLVLTTIQYIPANKITSILEFPSSNPLIIQSQGLKGARIEGNRYAENTNKISKTLSTCLIIDKIEIKKGEKSISVYIGIKTSGIENSIGEEIIYIPTYLVKSIVEFGVIDHGPNSSLKYTTLNFALDATGSTIIFYDVNTQAIIRTEAVNTIEAVENGNAGIKIERKGGLTTCVNKLNITGTYINGSLVTQVQEIALLELNTLFSNAGTNSGGLLSTNNLSDVTNTVTSLSNLGGEPIFVKNTAFNKDFGTLAGSILEGNTITISAAESTKLGFITITQAIDLDTITLPIVFSETQMYFTVDATLTTIIFSVLGTSINSSYPINIIEAVANGVNNIRIQLKGANLVIVNKLILSTIYINSIQVTQVQATAINELNTLFSSVIGASGNAPNITSPTTIFLTLGNSINYTLIATDGVSYSWDNLPSGVVTLEGNHRTIIGGTGLSAGIYNFIGRVTNYYGEDTINITLIVSAAFINTYSADGQWQVHYINSIVGQENNTPLYRPNMTGTATDAWSMLCWFKWRGVNFNEQTLFHFGHPSSTSDGRVHLSITDVGGSITVKLYYGSNSDYLEQIATTSISTIGWHSILLTYSGGNTGNNTLNITTYHDQFKCYVDGIYQTWTTLNNGNYGFIGSIDGTTNSSSPLSIMKKGYFSAFAPYLYIDEMAFWNNDINSDAMVLHNSGTPLDLTTLYMPLYTDYYRFGDGQLDIPSFPAMSNLGIGPNLTMISGSVSKYITDVP
jgi:hypothetical protein